MKSELTFYYGAMGCGKTRDLLKTLYSKEEDGFSVVIMKPKVDKKGGESVSSRDKNEKKADFLIKDKDNIYMLISEYLVDNNLNFILVDEAQFLTREHINQLSDIVDILGVSVICYGLRTDFKGELFEGSKRLFELSDNIKEIERQCSCGRKKIYNARKIDGEFVFDGDKIAIDGVDATYEAKCRYCYKENKKRLYGRK